MPQAYKVSTIFKTNLQMKDLRHQRQGDLLMIPQLAESHRDDRRVHPGEAVKSVTVIGEGFMTEEALELGREAPEEQ